MKKMWRIYGICQRCGRKCVLRASGGDFTMAIFPVFHKHNGKRCIGCYVEVPTEALMEEEHIPANTGLTGTPRGGRTQ